MSSLPLSVNLIAPNGVQYSQPLGLLINNEFVPARSGERIATFSPHDEEKIADVHAAGPEDVDVAVKAARDAFQGRWRRMPGASRGAILLKLASLMEDNKNVLATIDTWDNGKAINDTLEGVDDSVTIGRYYAGHADKSTGQTFETLPSQHVYTIREPLGVCGQIVPWNYPLLMTIHKLAPALAAGNCVVLRAAEQTPLSALYLASLIREVGIPPGVVNILNGLGRTSGAALAGHLDVDKVGFTGSTQTGKLVMQLASSNLKPVDLETGGKSPMLVFPDADLEKAAYWAHIGIMASSGQNCTANSRIFVHESVYDQFLDHFMTEIHSAKLGDPFDKDTFTGPVVNEAQRDRVLQYIDLGQKEGATLYTGGKLWANRPLGKGHSMEPTVFTNVTDDMRICREEIFGPVAVMKFKTESEAISRANDSIYGLGAAPFTKDVSRLHRVARSPQSGTIWANNSNSNMDPRVAFGGMKQSGIGRELGTVGYESYTNIRAVYLHLDENEGEIVNDEEPVPRKAHL
ncbi:Aldedh domain-containing protein [Fusarium keratoplasticum]|nr:Aldedh domain-containing protein [Fusarium keratoplasticum]